LACPLWAGRMPRRVSHVLPLLPLLRSRNTPSRELSQSHSATSPAPGLLAWHPPADCCLLPVASRRWTRQTAGGSPASATASSVRLWESWRSESHVAAHPEKKSGPACPPSRQPGRILLHPPALGRYAPL